MNLVYGKVRTFPTITHFYGKLYPSTHYAVTPEIHRSRPFSIGLPLGKPVTEDDAMKDDAQSFHPGSTPSQNGSADAAKHPAHAGRPLLPAR